MSIATIVVSAFDDHSSYACNRCGRVYGHQGISGGEALCTILVNKFKIDHGDGDCIELYLCFKCVNSFKEMFGEWW